MLNKSWLAIEDKSNWIWSSMASWLNLKSVLNGPVEETNHAFDESVWIFNVGHMVRALDLENLRDSFFEKLVSLNDFVSAVAAYPVLITKAKSYWEG